MPSRGALAGCRVGRLAHLYKEEQRADEATCVAIDAACAVLQMMGAEVCDVHLDNFRALGLCAQTILHYEAYALHRSRLAAAPGRYGERCRRALELGALITRTSYDAARCMRASLRQPLESLLSSCDLLVTAVVNEPACRLDDESALQRSVQGALRIPFNLTGHPALSLCVGFSQGGLPLAMQLIGREFRDESVLAVASAYQEATTWHLRRPSFDSNFTANLPVNRTEK